MVQNIQHNNVTQKLLSNVNTLYQTNQISEADKIELARLIKIAVRNKDYSEFLSLLNKKTKFCIFPEIVEDCRNTTQLGGF